MNGMKFQLKRFLLTPKLKIGMLTSVCMSVCGIVASKRTDFDAIFFVSKKLKYSIVMRYSHLLSLCLKLG